MHQNEEQKKLQRFVFWLIFALHYDAHKKGKERRKIFEMRKKSWRKGSYVAMANLFSNSIGVYSTNQDDFHALFVIHFHAKRERHTTQDCYPSLRWSNFSSLFSQAAAAADDVHGSIAISKNPCHYNNLPSVSLR